MVTGFFSLLIVQDQQNVIDHVNAVSTLDGPTAGNVATLADTGLLYTCMLKCILYIYIYIYICILTSIRKN